MIKDLHASHIPPLLLGLGMICLIKDFHSTSVIRFSRDWMIVLVYGKLGFVNSIYFSRETTTSTNLCFTITCQRSRFLSIFLGFGISFSCTSLQPQYLHFLYPFLMRFFFMHLSYASSALFYCNSFSCTSLTFYLPFSCAFSW